MEQVEIRYGGNNYLLSFWVGEFLGKSERLEAVR